MSETTNLKLFKHDNPSTNENQFDVTKALNNNWDKIDDFAETTNTKITENQNNIKSLQTDNTTNKKDIATLKSDNTTNKQDIANLKTENEELKAENERLNQDLNALPSNTAEGEYITLTDSADSRFNKFKILGKSTQATRSGKNKLDLRYLTRSGNFIENVDIETGSFELVNCWSTTIMYAEHIVKLLKPDTRYKMIADVTLLEKPETLNSYNNHNRLLILYNANAITTTVVILAVSNTTEKNNWQVNTTKHIETNFTTPADLSNYDIRAYNYNITEGETDKASGKFKYENVMILEATEEDETFEQFGVMPSPEFSSKIENVSEEVEMTICNNNLTNTDILALVNAPCVTINSKNSFSVDLSKGYVTMLQNIDLFLGKNDKNKRYKLSYHLQQNNNSFRPYLIIRYSDGTNTSSPNNGTNTEMDVTLTSSEGKTIEQIGFGWETQSAGGIATLSDIYLRQVDDNSEFQEQEKQEFVFPLAEGQRLYEGSYLADDGIHHKRKQFVVDGTETIYNASLITDKDTVSFNLNKPGAVGPYYGESPIRFCNIYGEDYIKDWGYFSDNPGSLGVGSTTNQLRFVIDNSFIGLVDNSDQEANQEKVANWLKNNNIVVEEVVDEYIETYTEEQQKAYDEIVKTAKTYKTVTNIFSTNEVSPKFEVNYRQDIKALINSTNKAVLNNA